MSTCPDCGEQNPRGARFCNACGAAFAAEDVAREERKVVTVVFCDVVGSTSLGERLDPEALRRVMARYFDAARTALERHGGTVEKFIGDAVMAVFGVPQAHEDDALRAVRAAADLRSAVADLSANLATQYDAGIEVRIGIDTGEVVTGTKERLATGDATNVAARLQTSARPGEILLGEATERLVRDAVEAEPVAPLAVKGKAAPLAAWRLLTVTSPTDPIDRRPESPLVGRDDELEQLRQALRRSVRERTAYLFSVLGPPGIGKSRVAAEFAASVAAEARVASGRCLSYGEGITFWPLGEIVDQLGDPAALLGGVPNAEVAASQIAAALGRSERSGSTEEIFWAFRKLFETLARDRPLVLVLDDLHWGEPTLLDLVEHLAEWTREAPLFLLCLARPDLFEARPGWGGGKRNATALFLEPLSETETKQLVNHVLARREVPADLRGRVAETAGGNPLYLEQMLAWIAERDGGAHVVVPPSIQALLAARLDGLKPDERALLERAAVVGKEFDLVAVAELASDELPRLRACALALVRKEFLRAGDDDTRFEFRHDLVRDAAYEGMIKELRAELHERFADWLERAESARLAELEEIVGYHLEQAHHYRSEIAPGDERAPELARRAAERLGSAGRKPFDRLDVPAAVNLLGRAIALLPVEDPSALPLLSELAKAVYHSGDDDAAFAALDDLEARAGAIGDVTFEQRARLLRAQQRVHSELDPPAIAVRTAQHAIDVLREVGDDEGLAEAWMTTAEAHWQIGEHELCEEAVARAIEHARRSGDERLIRRCYGGYYISVAPFGPLPLAEGIKRCHEALERFRDTPPWVAGTLSQLAVLVAMTGDIETARAHVEQAKSIMEEFGIGRVRWHEIPWQRAGIVELIAGDPDRAVSEFRRTLELCAPYHQPYASVCLARALYACGRFEEAEQAAELGDEMQDSDNEGYAVLHSVRARLAARRGDHEEAERLARRAVELASRTDALTMRGDVLLDLAEVLRLQDRAAEAAEAVEQALFLYERKGNVASAARARTLLGDVQQSGR